MRQKRKFAQFLPVSFFEQTSYKFALMHKKTKKAWFPRTILRLFTIGIGLEHSSSQKRDIVFTNEVIFFLSAVSIIITVIDFSVGHFERSMVNIAVALFLLPAYFLQFKKHFKWAKMLIVFVPTCMAVLSALLFGFQANAHFYILATFSLSMVLFQSFRQHLVSLAWHGPLFVSLLFLKEKWVAPIAGQDPVWMGFVHMSIVILCIFITLREYAMVFQGFEKKVVDLVDSIQEKNAELQAKTDLIEEQSLAIKKTNLELQKSIRELEHTEKLLRASNQELEHFAYMASHDLKEPLRTVGSFTSLIRRRLKGQLTDEIAEYFNFVVGGVKRMSTLLDDVLALSRLKNEVEFSQVDMNHVFKTVELNLQAKLAQTHAELTVPVLEENIIANKVHLNQLFQNLISNSLKFCREAAPKIKVGVEDQGGELLFSVADNGIGIAPEYQDKVFQIFHRLHDRTQFEGSGIGLAICQKIVASHGGKIWLESEEGIGTTIFFTINKVSKNHHHGHGPQAALAAA